MTDISMKEHMKRISKLGWSKQKEIYGKDLKKVMSLRGKLGGRPKKVNK